MANRLFGPGGNFVLLLILLSCQQPFSTIANAQDAKLTRGDLALRNLVGDGAVIVRLGPSESPNKTSAEQEERIRKSPGADKGQPQLRIAQVKQPSLVIMRPPATVGSSAAVILCPQVENSELVFAGTLTAARQLNEIGLTVAILKHATDDDIDKQWQVAVEDARRGIRLLRMRGGKGSPAEYKIGVFGIGNAGRLAATLSQAGAGLLKQNVETVEEQRSGQADFCLLVDPQHLAAPEGSRQLYKSLDRRRVSKQSAPSWLQLTSPGDNARGAVEYQLALIENGIDSELHVYGAKTSNSHGNLDSESVGEIKRFLEDQSVLKRTNKLPSPLTYKAKSLPAPEPSATQTLGDHRLLQILGRDCPQVQLWTGTAPDAAENASGETATARSRGGNALNIRQVSRPSITVVQPKAAKTDGRAVIVCPGGGYGGLAAEHEGVRVCEWFNEQGFTAILLKYRVPRRGPGFAKHHVAEQDLQRAMRIARSRANEWGIDPSKLGVCGFSAGGHLGAMLCTRFDRKCYEPRDALDKLSCRPDFAVLVYPAYLTEPRNSNHLDPALGAMNGKRTPPLFMTVARNDPFARGMLNFYLAARDQGVSLEAHLYASGGHGGGIDPVSYPTSQWTLACKRWLKTMKFPN